MKRGYTGSGALGGGEISENGWELRQLKRINYCFFFFFFFFKNKMYGSNFRGNGVGVFFKKRGQWRGCWE
jgi:hypothetical protein